MKYIPNDCRRDHFISRCGGNPNCAGQFILPSYYDVMAYIQPLFAFRSIENQTPVKNYGKAGNVIGLFVEDWSNLTASGFDFNMLGTVNKSAVGFLGNAYEYAGSGGQNLTTEIGASNFEYMDNVTEFTIGTLFKAETAGEATGGRLWDWHDRCLASPKPTGQIEFKVTRTGGVASVYAASGTLSYPTPWTLIINTFSDSNGLNMYRADENNDLAEVSYASETQQSGPIDGTLSLEMHLGNSAGNNRNFDGLFEQWFFHERDLSDNFSLMNDIAKSIFGWV